MWPDPRRPARYTLGERLASLACAVLFAVPTAFLIWLFLNTAIARTDRLNNPPIPFLGSPVLWTMIGVFLLLSAISPDLFLDLIGFLWKWIYRLGRWTWPY